MTNTAVYAAGGFTKVGAIDRLRLAAFHPTTGALLAWAPTADAGVNAILPTPDGSRIIVGGRIRHIERVHRAGPGRDRSRLRRR